VENPKGRDARTVQRSDRTEADEPKRSNVSFDAQQWFDPLGYATIPAETVLTGEERRTDGGEQPNR
jgi:hypothetical protein